MSSLRRSQAGLAENCLGVGQGHPSPAVRLLANLRPARRLRGYRERLRRPWQRRGPQASCLSGGSDRVADGKRSSRASRVRRHTATGWAPGARSTGRAMCTWGAA